MLQRPPPGRPATTFQKQQNVAQVLKEMQRIPVAPAAYPQRHQHTSSLESAISDILSSPTNNRPRGQNANGKVVEVIHHLAVNQPRLKPEGPAVVYISKPKTNVQIPQEAYMRDVGQKQAMAAEQSKLLQNIPLVTTNREPVIPNGNPLNQGRQILNRGLQNPRFVTPQSTPLLQNTQSTFMVPISGIKENFAKNSLKDQRIMELAAALKTATRPQPLRAVTPSSTLKKVVPRPIVLPASTAYNNAPRINRLKQELNAEIQEILKYVTESPILATMPPKFPIQKQAPRPFLTPAQQYENKFAKNSQVKAVLNTGRPKSIQYGQKLTVLKSKPEIQQPALAIPQKPIKEQVLKLQPIKSLPHPVVSTADVNQRRPVVTELDSEELTEFLKHIGYEDGDIYHNITGTNPVKVIISDESAKEAEHTVHLQHSVSENSGQFNSDGSSYADSVSKSALPDHRQIHSNVTSNKQYWDFRKENGGLEASLPKVIHADPHKIVLEVDPKDVIIKPEAQRTIIMGTPPKMAIQDHSPKIVMNLGSQKIVSDEHHKETIVEMQPQETEKNTDHEHEMSGDNSQKLMETLHSQSSVTEANVPYTVIDKNPPEAETETYPKLVTQDDSQKSNIDHSGKISGGKAPTFSHSSNNYQGQESVASISIKEEFPMEEEIKEKYRHTKQEHSKPLTGTLQEIYHKKIHNEDGESMTPPLYVPYFAKRLVTGEAGNTSPPSYESKIETSTATPKTEVVKSEVTHQKEEATTAPITEQTLYAKLPQDNRNSVPLRKFSEERVKHFETPLRISAEEIRNVGPLLKLPGENIRIIMPVSKLSPENMKNFAPTLKLLEENIKNGAPPQKIFIENIRSNISPQNLFAGNTRGSAAPPKLSVENLRNRSPPAKSLQENVRKFIHHRRLPQESIRNIARPMTLQEPAVTRKTTVFPRFFAIPNRSTKSNPFATTTPIYYITRAPTRWPYFNQNRSKNENSLIPKYVVPERQQVKKEQYFTSPTPQFNSSEYMTSEILTLQPTTQRFPKFRSQQFPSEFAAQGQLENEGEDHLKDFELLLTTEIPRGTTFSTFDFGTSESQIENIQEAENPSNRYEVLETPDTVTIANRQFFRGPQHSVVTDDMTTEGFQELTRALMPHTMIETTIPPTVAFTNIPETNPVTSYNQPKSPHYSVHSQTKVINVLQLANKVFGRRNHTSFKQLITTTTRSPQLKHKFTYSPVVKVSTPGMAKQTTEPTSTRKKLVFNFRTGTTQSMPMRVSSAVPKVIYNPGNRSKFGFKSKNDSFDLVSSIKDDDKVNSSSLPKKLFHHVVFLQSNINGKDSNQSMTTEASKDLYGILKPATKPYNVSSVPPVTEKSEKKLAHIIKVTTSSTTSESESPSTSNTSTAKITESTSEFTQSPPSTTTTQETQTKDDTRNVLTTIEQSGNDVMTENSTEQVIESTEPFVTSTILDLQTEASVNNVARKIRPYLEANATLPTSTKEIITEIIDQEQMFVDSLKSMKVKMQDLATKGLRHFMPLVMELSADVSISSDCTFSLLRWLRAVRTMEQWAVRSKYTF